MNVVDYFFENSSKLDKCFVINGVETIYFNELYSKISTLATFLNTTFGTGKEILLLSENNLFFIISYLSIIKSGNIVILVETRISENDLISILDKCSINAFFIQTKYANILKFNENVFNETILQKLTTVDQCPEIESEDVAVVIFTSGSTGSKKGVMLTHQNIRENTESIIKYLSLTEKDRIEVVLPFFYCYGASLLHTHLRVGGSIVLNQGIFLKSIYEIDQYQCTGFVGVPSTYQILIQNTNFLQRKYPALRYFTQAGGKLADKFITQIIDSFPDKSFYVMYGQTEATARLSYLPPELLKTKLGSIGKGIPGVTLEVLDENGNQIEPDNIGEIVAKGNNIMKGYYKDPDATRDVLKNGKLYTGDLATIDNDGFIYIVGRSNNIIKSAGYRISPYEIEEFINSIDSSLNCAVFGIPDDIVGEAIVAIVETKKPSEDLKLKISMQCNKSLPSYKVPKYIKFIDDFPLNSSNKIDRKKIKEMLFSNSEENGCFD